MSILVFVGLGNPEPEYTGTRHNVGFQVLNAWASKHGISWKKDRKLKAELTKITTPEFSILLVKPQTYMNRSGESLKAIQNYFRLKPSHFVVVYDDVGIELGRQKISQIKSAGGHNGIQSILELLGTDFVRVRVGIGPRPAAMEGLANFVLGKFSSAEQQVIDLQMPIIIQGLELMAEQGVVKAMNKLNQ